MRPNPDETAYLVTFTDKILYGKLHFLYSVKFQLKIKNGGALHEKMMELYTNIIKENC